MSDKIDMCIAPFSNFRKLLFSHIPRIFGKKLKISIFSTKKKKKKKKPL